MRSPGSIPAAYPGADVRGVFQKAGPRVLVVFSPLVIDIPDEFF
jgi:hypothetical protein